MRRRLLEIALVTVLLVATGCVPGENLSDADETFVAHMIPHHEIGMELMEVATTHADDVRLRRLVFEMGDYHHSDMGSLLRWSTEWGVERSDDFPGDISDETLQRLESLAGAKFDVAWLEVMIDHHEGALDISRAALEHGARRDVEDLARSTIEVQSREITEMSLLRDEICTERACE